jgi:hypothetical protein
MTATVIGGVKEEILSKSAWVRVPEGALRTILF